MDAATEGIKDALRKAGAMVAEALMRDFPELYILSAKALSEDLNSTPHFSKLGQYLLGEDGELGCSPAEALADGRGGEVLNQLAVRGGIDPASVRFVELPVPPDREEASRKPGPVHITYCDYYATGEGVTVLIALGGTAESARETFQQSAPTYFHQGLVEDVLVEDAGPNTRRMQRWVPQAAMDIIATNPPGTTTYYAALHFNLA